MFKVQTGKCVSTPGGYFNMLALAWTHKVIKMAKARARARAKARFKITLKKKWQRATEKGV